jgi:hypothetical protein
MRRIICRIVCTAESITDSRSAISHTLHNVVEKLNPYRSINRLSEPTPASLLSPPHNVIYIKAYVSSHFPLYWVSMVRIW